MTNILIVDDIEQNLYLLSQQLEGSGYTVVPAHNGVEALEIARKSPPDLVISDILMPVMDGFALCRAWMADEELCTIPFIFYTATYTNPRDERFALDLGAARFVVKPMETEDFVSLVTQVIQEVESGNLVTPRPTLEEETTYYRLYNEALIRKLEDKMLELESVNQVMEKDIQQRKETELRLRRTQERLQLTVQAGNVGLWDWHLKSNRVYYSPEWKSQIGYEDHEIGDNFNEWLERVHPDDLESLMQAIQAYIENPWPDYQQEFRFRHKDGSYRWILTQASLIRDENDAPLRMLGTHIDITRRKNSEVEKSRLLEESRRRLRYLETLHDIDVAIRSSLDFQGILNILLSHLVTQLKVDAADLLLVSHVQGSFIYAAGTGFRTHAPESANIPLGMSFAGQAAKERRVIYQTDAEGLQSDPGFARLWEEEDFKAYFGIPLYAKDELIGVLEVFHRSDLNPDQEWREFLQILGGQAAIAIDNALMYENVQRTNAALTLAYDATIEGWSRAMDLRDKETEGHTQRVAQKTLRLARTLIQDEEQLLNIRRGALLHDIGKMGIPDAILFKPDRLTEAEWEIMRQHPQYAYDMLASIEYLQPALEIPYCHHEKWDGSGYPRGLAGNEIPLAARLFAVVDVWDALTSDRPYRPAWSREKALAYIQDQAGKHFDPQVVDLFMRTVKENGGFLD